MGYTTDFYGSFTIDKPLKPEHAAYLLKFVETRRMARDEKKASKFPDPVREAVGLPVGKEGGYFVGGRGFAGQDGDDSVIKHNDPPADQPGLWCQCIPNNEGTEIKWDGNEKFYNYTEWLEYLIEHFLKPWGYVLNGEVEWEGEDRGDMGKIVVKNNDMSTRAGKVSYSRG
jgi:hypothetical protein